MAGAGARTELPVVDSLLSEFLTLLEAAQKELHERWNVQKDSGRHTDRA
ncbi:hypothetical protein ABT301_13640 [Streptomyces sp. NPDC000987]